MNFRCAKLELEGETSLKKKAVEAMTKTAIRILKKEVEMRVFIGATVFVFTILSQAWIFGSNIKHIPNR